MAQRLQELCGLLVEDTCGLISSQIFLHLAKHGRLPRYKIHADLRVPGRQLRHALASLTQQHILLHTSTDDGVSFYQVDWRSSYNLLRANRITSLVEERYGEGAGKIVANLLQLGHARVGDLAQAFNFTSASKRDSGIDTANGEAKTNGVDAHHARPTIGKIITLGQFHAMLRTLLKADFLTKLGKRAYTPAADLQTEIEEVIISEQFPDRKITGPKKQAEFKLAVSTLKRKWRESNDYSDHRDLASSGNINNAAKRVKLNGGLTNGVGHHGDNLDSDESVPKLPNEMILRVNFAQCNLALRSQRLEQMAEPYLGGVTSSVYGALLQALETKLRARDDDVKEERADDVDEEELLPTAATAEVAAVLDPTIDLTLGVQGIADAYQMPNGEEKKGEKKGKKKARDEDFSAIGIKKESNSDDEEDHPANGHMSFSDRTKRLSLIEEHLKLLEEHPQGFCRRVRRAGGGEWRVNFPALTDALIHAEIDLTVLSRFGKVHKRIVRMLRERGRLEDKQIAAYAMMRAKDVRVVLTELQFAGLVEGQEVPKDNTRQPSRAVYLWFHDQDRISSMLLQQTYQGISRTLQRLKVERENYKNIIDKAEMVDVKQEALMQSERDAILQWREIEEKLLVQVHRMDELVALLRDFSGKDCSLVS